MAETVADARIDNFFFENVEAGMIDFQLVSISCIAYDVMYAISSQQVGVWQRDEASGEADSGETKRLLDIYLYWMRRRSTSSQRCALSLLRSWAFS